MSEISTLEFSEIGFAYQNEEPMFQGISFSIIGKSCIFLKPNDFRGVSTLTKILSGLASPNSGRYLINGQDVCQMSFEDFLPWRLKMGYAFESGGLLSNLTLEENLSLPLKYHFNLNAEQISEKVDFYIRYFDLAKEKNKRPAMVNASSKKLVVLARSLIHNPQCLILDDPDNGLNKAQVLKLISLVKSMIENENLRIVFVASRLTKLWEDVFTHQLEFNGTHARLDRWMDVAKESA